jgi:cyclopropane fatty-acyl-phospholipid synthase-like methyltransferase
VHYDLGNDLFKLFLDTKCATTLRCWRDAFFANIDQIRIALFGRADSTLDFYLCYCEGGFIERDLVDVQMLLVNPEHH